MVFFLLFYQLNTHFSDLTELLFTYDSAVCKAKLFFLNVKVINFIYKTRVSWGAEGHFKIVLSSLQLFTSPGCVCLCSIPVPPFVCYVSSFCPENNGKDETSALQLFAQTFTLEHARASTLSDVRRWGTRIVERARWRQQGLVLECREGGAGSDSGPRRQCGAWVLNYSVWAWAAKLFWSRITQKSGEFSKRREISRDMSRGEAGRRVYKTVLNFATDKDADKREQLMKRMRRGGTFLLVNYILHHRRRIHAELRSRRPALPACDNKNFFSGTLSCGQAGSQFAAGPNSCE